MTDLSVETVDEPNGIVLRLIGSADLGGSATLDRQLMIVSTRHPKLVVLDLSGLEFISSLCMGSLVRFSNSAKHWSGKVLIAAATEPVATALRRARLDQVLPMYDSVEMAFSVKLDAL